MSTVVAREAGQDRRPHRAPRSLRRVPAGRGHRAPIAVREHPAPDRSSAAKAAATPGMRIARDERRQPQQARCVHHRPRTARTRRQTGAQASQRGFGAAPRAGPDSQRLASWCARGNDLAFGSRQTGNPGVQTMAARTQRPAGAGMTNPGIAALPELRSMENVAPSRGHGSKQPNQ
jgi:hypothetical protein